MSRHEQLSIPSPTNIFDSTYEGILPYKAHLKELTASLIGKLVTVVHERVGQKEPDIENLFFYGMDFNRIMFIRPHSGFDVDCFWLFAGVDYGISQISIGTDEEKKVIYSNPDIRDHYREAEDKPVPSKIREELFNKGRWFLNQDAFK